MTIAAFSAAVERTLDSIPKVNGHPPLPAPVFHGAKPDPGEVLSPSQANTFLQCPAKWMFRYLLDTPTPQNAARFTGSCLHRALGANWLYKIGAREDLPLGEVLAAYDTSWADGENDVAWTGEDDRDELRKTGKSLVEVYMAEAAPSIQPAAVEVPVSGRIAGVPVRGFVDMLDADGRIIDVKSAKRKPSGVSQDYRLQVATYDVLFPQSRGEARLDTVVKSKAAQVVQHTILLGAADVQFVEQIYPMVSDSIRDGVYYPRRDGVLCSRRYCPYWKQCEAEFGGEVDA